MWRERDPQTMQTVSAKVKPIPEGYHSVTPYMIVDNATKLIDFIKQTFNAEERERIMVPGGRVSHAELKIGDSVVMLSDPSEEFKAMPSMIYVYVDDIDRVYARALEAGATPLREPKNQFYGDRNANIKDPFGNVWGIATHIEDVPPEELQRRIKESMAS